VPLKDEATYRYHVELGAILVIVVILCLLVFLFKVMKKRMKGGGDSGKDDLKNISVDSPGKVPGDGLARKPSFQYVGLLSQHIDLLSQHTERKPAVQNV
jgi:hypothetical protein